MTENPEQILRASSPAAADAIARARAEKSALKRADVLREAFDAVGFRGRTDDADALTYAQRALATIVALEPSLRPPRGPFAIPHDVHALRRWIGIDPKGALEDVVDYEVGDEKRRGPLWKAFKDLYKQPLPRPQDRWWRRVRAIVRNKSLTDQLTILGQMTLDQYDLAMGSPDGTGAYGVDWPSLDRLSDEGRDWAPRFADRLLAQGPQAVCRAPKARAPLFVSLARAGVPIESRWDPLLPVWRTGRPELRESIAAIPPERRAAAVHAASSALFPDPARLMARALERTARGDSELSAFISVLEEEHARSLEKIRTLRFVDGRRFQLPPVPGHGRPSADDSVRPGLPVVTQLTPLERRQLIAVVRVLGSVDEQAEVPEDDDFPRVLADLLSLDFPDLFWPTEWWDVVDEDGVPRFRLVIVAGESAKLMEARGTLFAGYGVQLNLFPEGIVNDEMWTALGKAHVEAARRFPESDLASFGVWNAEQLGG